MKSLNSLITQSIGLTFVLSFQTANAVQHNQGTWKTVSKKTTGSVKSEVVGNTHYYKKTKKLKRVRRYESDYIWTGKKWVLKSSLSKSQLARLSRRSKKSKKIHYKSRAASTGSSVVKTEVKKKAEKPYNKFNLNYYNSLSGTTLSRWDGFSPNPDGSLQGRDAVNLYNAITLGYRTSADTKLYTEIRFLLYPVEGDDFFTALNPRVGYNFGTILTQGNFSLGLKIDTEVPVSKSAQLTGLITAPRISISPKLKLGESDFTLKFSAFVRYHFYRVSGPNHDLVFWGFPTLNYQPWSNLGFNLSYEFMTIHHRGEPVGEIFSQGTNLQFMTSWDINSMFNIGPYIKVYPSDTVSADSTALGFEFNAAIL
ncbi:MAG: hypothetical protein CL678_08145 [Bdellovibrionaceae bacterium]|nr:hypothetical protein [Pseudobdellovibrionaceae bacterium]|tara:strand:- start:4147 stop:5250 length:1104 start_codon:yes stop_codon:yes gene_type:complete